MKSAETLLAQLPTSTFEHYAEQLIGDITPFNWTGRDAAVFMVDARSFRDASLPPVSNPFNPAEVGAFMR